MLELLTIAGVNVAVVVGVAVRLEHRLTLLEADVTWIKRAQVRHDPRSALDPRPDPDALLT